MTKLTSIRAEFVEHIPAKAEPGVIYISHRFRTATHLCCCGCGLEVVTPLNPAKWTMTQHGDVVSLRPSIGNWSFPCRSHYWVERGKVRWAGTMTTSQIRHVRSSDAASARREFDLPAPTPPTYTPQHVPQPRGWISVIGQWLRRLLG